MLKCNYVAIPERRKCPNMIGVGSLGGEISVLANVWMQARGTRQQCQQSMHWPLNAQNCFYFSSASFWPIALHCLLQVISLAQFPSCQQTGAEGKKPRLPLAICRCLLLWSNIKVPASFLRQASISLVSSGALPNRALDGLPWLRL